MAWFRKTKQPRPLRQDRARSTVPEGLWVKCEGCKEIVYSRELDKNLRVCPKCGYHFRIDARARIALLLDEPEPKELFAAVSPSDPLGFRDTKRYRERLKTYQQAVGERDAVVVVQGDIEEIPVVLAALEYRFMGGSMGSVVGEKVTRAAERALDRLAARRRLRLRRRAHAGGHPLADADGEDLRRPGAPARREVPYLSVLTDPTTGGVTASFAMLGDLILAEPGALIGFAGPRVIEQTIRQSLPEGFQRSEFLLEHGLLDMIVPRAEMKATLARCLRHLS